MNTLNRARPAAALILFGLLGLLTIPFVQPGVGQDAPPNDEDRLNRTSDPGVTKDANTLFYVGKIASIDEDRLTVVLADTKEQTFQVHDQTRIVLDGKRAELTDLRPTDAVKISADIGHRDRADVIVVARADRVVDESAHSTEPVNPSARSAARLAQSGQLWQGKLFVAPLAPDCAAALAGLRPGDIILLVEPDAALDSDAALQGLRILPTASNPAIVLGGVPAAGQVVPGGGGVVPGNVGAGVVVPGNVGAGVVVPGNVGTGVAVPGTVPGTTVQPPVPGDTNTNNGVAPAPRNNNTGGRRGAGTAVPNSNRAPNR